LKGAGFSAPHCEHRLASGAPQFPQNFMPSGFSNPHFEQSCTLQVYPDCHCHNQAPWRASTLMEVEGKRACEAVHLQRLCDLG
jgi:hypothetical protein